MKKILLFTIAALAITLFANAQNFVKLNSLEDEVPAAGTVWTVDGCSMLWYDTPSGDGVKENEEVISGDQTFGFTVQGSNNPKPWQYPEIGAGAMWLFDCTKSGTLTIVTAVNSQKNTYIVETPIVEDKTEGNYCYVLCGEEGVTDYLYADEATFQAGAKFVTATTSVGDKLFNGARSWDIWDLVEGESLTMPIDDRTAADAAAKALTSWIYDAMVIKADANKCYNYFCTGSKACIYGFIFTPEEEDPGEDPGTNGVNSIDGSAKVISTEYYNTMGAKFNEPVKGVNIIIQKMSDGKVKTSKGIFFR